MGGVRVSLTSGDEPRSRLFVRAGDAVLSLEEWIAWVSAQIGRLTAEVDRLTSQATEIHRELSGFVVDFRKVRNLPREGADLRRCIDELDQRLNNVLDLVEQQISGHGPTEQAMLHHDYAAEYLALVEQKILALALDVLDERIATPLEKAEFVAFMCLQLFGEPEVREDRMLGHLRPDRAGTLAGRIQDICAQARELREKAARGRPQRWDFTCVRGAPPDAERQEPWPGSAEEGVVDFVVAPAYVVDSDTLLKKQRVYITAPE
jgi:hypothetical protein